MEQKEKSARGNAMELRWAPLELLALLLLGVCSGSSQHSLHYQYVVVSKPSEGLPQFFMAGYLDDQLITSYDSQKKEKLPKVSWMKEVDKEDPDYWEDGSEILKATEQVLQEDLRNVQHRYKQKGGFHTWQTAYGCELRGNNSKGGYSQYGYDGRTFLAFDKETVSWEAPDPQAQITKRNWDANWQWSQRNKLYLEEECIEWLEKYLSYRKKEMLPRTGPQAMAADDDAELPGPGQPSPGLPDPDLPTPNLPRKAAGSQEPGPEGLRRPPMAESTGEQSPASTQAAARRPAGDTAPSSPPPAGELRRSTRARRRPAYLRDYACAGPGGKSVMYSRVFPQVQQLSGN